MWVIRLLTSPNTFSIEPEPFKSLNFFLRDLTIYFLEIENNWKLRKYIVKLNGIGNQIGLYKEFGPFVHFFNLQQKTSLVELHWNTITKTLSHLDPQQAKISWFWNYFHFNSPVQASSLKKKKKSQLTKNKNFHFTAQWCVLNNFSLDKHRHQIWDEFLFQF